MIGYDLRESNLFESWILVKCHFSTSVTTTLCSLVIVILFDCRDSGGRGDGVYSLCLTHIFLCLLLSLINPRLSWCVDSRNQTLLFIRVVRLIDVDKIFLQIFVSAFIYLIKMIFLYLFSNTKIIWQVMIPKRKRMKERKRAFCL